MKTKEYVNGKYIVVDAAFKKYPNWLASIKDHSAMFNRLERYKNLRGERDYKTACRNVQKRRICNESRICRHFNKNNRDVPFIRVG